MRVLPSLGAIIELDHTSTPLPLGMPRNAPWTSPSSKLADSEFPKACKFVWVASQLQELTGDLNQGEISACRIELPLSTRWKIAERPLDIAVQVPGLACRQAGKNQRDSGNIAACQDALPQYVVIAQRKQRRTAQSVVDATAGATAAATATRPIPALPTAPRLTRQRVAGAGAGVVAAGPAEP